MATIAVLSIGEEARVAVDPSLRKLPNYGAEVVAAMPVDTLVRIRELDPARKWCRVHALGKEGWVPLVALATPNAPAEPITPDAKLMHAPRATLAVLTDAILSRPHGAYSETDVRFIVRTYTGTCAPVGLDPLLAIAQMRLETGNLSSPWAALPHRNPAGIGVTGSGDGISFPSWVYSVRAHVGRVLAYAIPAGRETPLQKRVIDEALEWRTLSTHLRGAAPTLAGLAGTWAADPQYAHKLSRVANEILGTTPPTPPPDKPRIVTARSLGLAFKNIWGMLGPELWVTGHYSAGERARNDEEGARRVRSYHADHTNKGWGGIGYHYLLADNGTVFGCRPTILNGTHTKLHNTENIGVVMPGTTGDRPTAQQAASFQWLLANAHTDALPPAHRTDRDLRLAKRRGHKQWPDNSTSCPGLFLPMYLSGGNLTEEEPGDVEEEVGEPQRPDPFWAGGIFVDHEHVSEQEAQAAPDPATVDEFFPPPTWPFDDEAPSEPQA